MGKTLHSKKKKSLAPVTNDPTVAPGMTKQLIFWSKKSKKRLTKKKSATRIIYSISMSQKDGSAGTSNFKVDFQYYCDSFTLERRFANNTSF